MDFEELDSVLSKSSGKEPATPLLTGEETLRERFRRTMFFQEVKTPPNFEFGYWDDTLVMWREQGLPADVVDEASAYRYFGIENWDMLNVNSSPLGIYEHKTLEEDDNYITYRDSYGCVAQINKKGHKSIPHYLDFPIKDRKTWEPFKAALDPDDERRWTGFAASVEYAKRSQAPIGIFGGSMVGVPRNLIGFQGIAMMQYEDPDLLADIINAHGACTVAVLEKALPHCPVDFAMGWEDICFNQGPIVSPDFFHAVAGPWYRRIAELLRIHGCSVYTTDTDGNIMPIINTFVENGLTTLFPVEVHGGTDPVAIRRLYGKRVKLWGGFCKMALSAGREAIDKELERLRPCVEQGGFLLGVDHRVQADVRLDHYKYYLDRKRELFHVGGEPQY